MDQNQTTVDNDLQKAIDDITNTTNVDPVFSDPVAAPSSVPEGDTGELGEPVGPFPEPQVATVTPAPEPIAPLQSMDIPELNVPEINPAPEPAPTPNPTPAPTSPTEEPANNASTEPTSEELSQETEPISKPLNTNQIKTAALRDLVPIISKINASPSERFGLYRDIFENLKDYTVLEPAYHSAREITDETERANALLYLIEAIDKM